MEPTTNKEYAPHQQRVVDEKNELQDKHSKLGAFILDNPIFNTLDSEEQEDLRSQNDVMGEYLDILERRISRF
jgi:hypothetical protein